MAIATQMAMNVAIGALMAVSILELSFIVNMVAWVHDTASGTFSIVNSDGTKFDMAGEPKNIMVDQGHTSNGAAGTAFVLVGLGGVLVLYLRSRHNFRDSATSVFLYKAWLVINGLALLLTLAALAYVFAVTIPGEGQKIDLDIASKLNGEHYPEDDWTPQTWFCAVLELELADGGVRSDIHKYLQIMRGWQYNLVPLLLIQLVETVLVYLDAKQYFAQEWKIQSLYSSVDIEK